MRLLMSRMYSEEYFEIRVSGPCVSQDDGSRRDPGDSEKIQHLLVSVHRARKRRDDDDDGEARDPLFSERCVAILFLTLSLTLYSHTLCLCPVRVLRAPANRQQNATQGT